MDDERTIPIRRRTPQEQAEYLQDVLIRTVGRLARARMLIRDLAGADFDRFVELRDEARAVLDYLEGDES